MAKYVDGFVIPLKKKNLAAYRRLAKQASKVWMEYGAVEFRECVAEDLDTKGAGSPFPKQLKMQRDETLLFSWIAYKSRAHRDRVNAKVMKDPRITKLRPEDMPFDPRRMMWGGFSTIVEAG